MFWRKMLKIIGTIEARMGATRLPGKTLQIIYNDLPLLACVVKRFKLCKTLQDVVVATTDSPQDIAIVEWCEQNKVNYFRGSEQDVLDRVAKAAVKYQAAAIVQMGADSAYLDFQLIDHLVELYKRGNYDYVCNDLKSTYPWGIYGHVVNVQKLVELNDNKNISGKDRDDVVRHIFEHPELYKLHNIEAGAEYAFPELRFTIDYPEDLEQARVIYKYFDRYDFTTQDLIKLYQSKPAIFEKTKSLLQKSAPFIKQSVNNHG
jgi:spore coat polysaccharide biosynthesis protein SpsF